MGILLVILVSQQVSKKLENELIERGRAIGSNLAHFTEEQILENDEVGLRQLLSNILNFESVEYILIQKSDSTVLADTYNGQIPKELLAQNPSSANQPPVLVDLKASNAECYDIWVPIEEGYIGYIRVGMRQDYIKASVQKTKIMLLMIIGALTLIGIIIVIFLANRMINPILYLTKRADDISQGKLEEKINVTTHDEIEQLGQALERLRESVKIALDRLKKQHTLRV